MIYSLENEKIKITASEHGGELHSITGKREGTEYLLEWESGILEIPRTTFISYNRQAKGF